MVDTTISLEQWMMWIAAHYLIVMKALARYNQLHPRPEEA